jgi:uncharacterized surface protein with fasciclin (FAS1) repeats
MAVAMFMTAVLTPGAGATEKPMAGGDSVATVDQSSGQWFLRNDDGSAEQFYFGDDGDVPMLGDWDGDGVATPGVYRQSDGRIYLRNSNTQGVADLWFYFGNPGDVPIVGDWNGDGFDTLSIFRPSTNQFFIINELGANGDGLGAAEYSFTFGVKGDVPFTGDWDGDGIDGVALYRESTGEVFFRNSLSTGVAEVSTVYGNPGDVMIGGDWDGDSVDTLGVYRGNQFFLQNTPVRNGVGLGPADETFSFGEAGFFPLAGFFMAKIGAGPPDIVETARAAGDFDILIAALEAAGLDDDLKGPGPFTVFAPTDEAFEALPDGVLDALLGDIPTLERVLKYHVASGLQPASELAKLDGESLETIGGELVWVDVDGQSIYLNESTPTDPLIIISDIKTSNGIIHVIDGVMVPQDIVETASASGDFDALVAAVTAAGLADALSAPSGPFTVFAPTGEAFEALPDGVLDDLLGDIPALTDVLLYHVLSGTYDLTAVASWDGGTTPATLNGATIEVDVHDDGWIFLNERTPDDPLIILADIKTSNGIIHVIDGVLIPPAAN